MSKLITKLISGISSPLWATSVAIKILMSFDLNLLIAPNLLI